MRLRSGWFLNVATGTVALICLMGCAAPVSETNTRTNNVATNQAASSYTPVPTAPTPVTPTYSAPAPVTPKPKAAVYIMGNPEGRDALRMAVNTFLIKSGKYQMVAVDAIDVVAREHQRQMSGSVSDEQISRWGYDAGAQYVCVVERTELDGFSYVATRMISVESKVAEFADMVKMPRGGDVIEFIQWQIGSMLGMAVGPRPTAGASANTAPTNTVPAQSTTTQSGTTPNANTSSKTITIKTVKIGNQTWMAENLNIKTGNSWCYNEDNSYCYKYGRLYDWETAIKACPKGWHLPSNQEWDDLVDAAGGRGVAGMKLKARNGWDNNGNGTDNYGFSALPGGSFGSSRPGSAGFWWTASQVLHLDNKIEHGRIVSYLGHAYYRKMGDYYDVRGSNDRIESAMSVRCVADN